MALTKVNIQAELKKMPSGRSREDVQQRNELELDLFNRLTEEGRDVSEISELTGWSPVKTYVLRCRSEATPVDPTSENVVKLRDEEGQAWGYISAATGLTEPAVKRMYTEHTGVPHNESRVVRRNARSKSEPEKKVAKKTAARKRKPRKAKEAAE